MWNKKICSTNHMLKLKINHDIETQRKAGPTHRESAFSGRSTASWIDTMEFGAMYPRFWGEVSKILNSFPGEKPFFRSSS